MLGRSTNLLFSLILLVACVPLFSSTIHAQDPPEEDNAKLTAITSLPNVDRAIHDAMQSRAYGDAIKLIETAIGNANVANADYLLLLQGIAHAEAKQYAESIAAYKALEAKYPKSDWISRSRFGRAHVLVMQRQYIDAGKIYQEEAERLLSRGRKDDLAKIYLEFADRYFDGIPAEDPSKAKNPDYKQALEYYSEAVKLGPTAKLKQKIEFRIARCHHELNQHDQAIKAYNKFIADYGNEQEDAAKRADQLQLIEASHRLGAVQLKAGRREAARKTWQDLLADHGNKIEDKNADEMKDFLAESEYRIAHTYGLPNVATVGDLELGVAAAERFLKKHPNHELAPKAELEIAQGYSRQNRHPQAVTRLQALIKNPKYADSEQVPIARELLGQAFLVQGEYDKAIEAWKAFLDKHPTDPKWPAVQRRIVDTEYSKGEYARGKKRYADARKIWQTFLNKYPLDPRAPRVLLQFGQMKFAESSAKHDERVAAATEKGESALSVKINEQCKTLFEEAIADWRRVVTKYPNTGEASNASYMIGVTLEDKLDDLKQALESYKKVKGGFAGRASTRIKRLTAPQLILVTERKFRSDEKPRIKLTTRNLEKVTVKTYRIDMVDYFRKMHLASGVETLDIALIDPDEQFEHSVKDYAEFERIDDEVELPINEPGVTAVTVSSDKLEVTTMVVVSDLDMIVKASRNELFLFAENMRTGKPVPGVSVLISDGAKVFAEEVTAKDGLMQKSFDELKSVKDLRVFAVQEGHMASTVNNLNGLNFAVGLTPRGYLYTDRPAYRKGQLVNIKGLIRWVDEDRFTFKSDTKFRLDIYDARGQLLSTKEVALNAFGTINSNFVLPESAPQGDYRVHLHRASTGPDDDIGALTFETRFRVTEYKLEPLQISIDLDKPVYFRGEKVKADVTLQYYYGTPLAGETIEYTFGGGEQKTAKTDEKGKVSLEFETQRFSESQPLKLTVNYRERGLTQSATAILSTRGFAISGKTMRDVFINGETFSTEFLVADPSGKPVETKLKIEVLKIQTVQGQVGEKLVESHEATTDAESGKATQVLKLDEGGQYFVRATGKDQFGNDVSGQTRVYISGKKDATRLRILADQFAYDVGEKAKVKLHWREKPALALVTYEGASILGYQLVQLKEGDNELQFPMKNDFAPNFILSVAVMQRNLFHSAQTEFRVSQQLKIALKPSKDELKPGDDLNVEIEVTDPLGNPVKAELSLAMIQTNLLNRFADVQGPVNAFFQSGYRRSAIRQSTSCTFQYKPRTRAVSQMLLAEAERRETLEREVRALAEVGGRGVAPNFGGGMQVDASIANMQLEPGNSAMIIAGDYITADPFGSTQVMAENRIRSVPVQRIRTETRTREVPFTTMTKQIRNGRVVEVPVQSTRTESYQVSVPYTEQVTQSYTVQAPQGGAARYTQGLVSNGGVQVQQIQELGQVVIRGRLSDVNRVKEMIRQQEAQQHGGYAGRSNTPIAVNEFLDRNLFMNKQITINGVTNRGQFLAVNGRGEEEIEKLVREDGLQLLPAMAHAETAFWDPTIVTDDQGKALVTITTPARSTAWRLRAKGINDTTLAGEATADLITKKDLFGEMQLPLALTVGDKAEIPVEVHCALDGARTIKVTLKATMGDKSTEQTKTIDVQGPGINDLQFPVEIDDTSQLSLDLTVTSDDLEDKVSQTITVRPFGFPVYQTASGTSSQSTLAMIDFDEQLQASGPSMEILIGSNLNRTLIEAVTGGGSISIISCGLPTSSPLERSASDILGGIGLLKMINAARDRETPESQAIAGRISSAVTHLVSAQSKKGGWSWSGSPMVGQPAPFLTSRVMWALASARDSGFAVPQNSFSLGESYLKKVFSSTPRENLEQQTVILHALAACGCADFSFANRLHRERNRLSAAGLSYLSLTLSAMNRKEMAGDLIGLIKLPTDNKPLTAEQRRRILPYLRNRTELHAVYMLALQAAKPNHPDLPKLAKSLLATRVGTRWPVEKANGPAIAALADWHAKSQNLSEKYKLAIFVNDEEIDTLEIDPKKDHSRRVQVPAELLRQDRGQRVEFELDGRATFSYSVLLTGFVEADKMKSTAKDWAITRRYEPAQQMFDGRVVPRGFGVVNGNYKWFSNPLTQLPVGDRGEVTLSPRRYRTDSAIGEQPDYLVLTEPIPAGCTILDGSVKGAFDRYEIESGRIVFHIGNRRHTGDIRYTLVGYIPGEFRAPQSILRSFYEPDQFAVSKIKELQILDAGSDTDDDYRLTPDELYYLGDKEFAKGNFDTAHEHLSQLFDNWRLDNDKYKNTAQWLFSASLAKNNHADSVKYFEVLKEKFPDVEISFEDILAVANSYRELGEYERSYLVYRATVEGSFERESQVAGFLKKRGEFVRSVQAMERLLRDYPAESYLATASYALAQETYRRAPGAKDDKKLREAGITRVHLIDGAIDMLDHFVTTWPEDPSDDQASFALATALLDLEKYESAIERSEKYAERYPDSRLLDSFWYMIGYSHFELEHPQEALTMCRKVAEAKFPVAETGGTRPADNRWEAIYIMGQIYHSLGDAAKAIAEYTKVKERFADATEAVKFFSRKDIAMDEVTTIKPDAAKKVELRFRNVAEAAIKVYRIDLMKFGLMQRNLDRITAINLAGIKPHHEETVALGDGKDFRDRTRDLSLPLKEEGAYLIVCRGDNLYASGLALVSPLDLLVQEDAKSGRVRVSVKDSTKDKFVGDVHVKVIGSANKDFTSGETDLRGLFIADDVKGNTTVIAASGENRYAFYRGDISLQMASVQQSPNAPADPFGAPAAEENSQQPMPQSKAYGKDLLRSNLFDQNKKFQLEQKGNFDDLLDNNREGIKSKEAY